MREEMTLPAARVGLVAIEPIRQMGIASAFENHHSIDVVMDTLEVILDDRSICHLILDMTGRSNLIDVQFMIRRRRPDMQLIVLGQGNHDELVLRSIMAGARAYLDSASGPFAIRLAVESVLQGMIWASRRVLTALVDRLMNQAGTGMLAAQQPLSPRERQVLDLILSARSNREIAMELGIEERTVKAYVANLLRKTGADNRVSLSVQATQNSIREQRTPSS